MTVKNIIPEYRDPKERATRIQSTYTGLQQTLVRRQQDIAEKRTSKK